MKATDVFIKSLENEGVRYIFGVPGEENLDFLNSLKSSTIKFIVTRNEQAAGFMAATMGRLTGKAGVCLSTLGPGATNLVTAAAYANLGAMPLVMITGQKGIKHSRQGHFQIVHTTQLMQPVTKMTKQIISGDSISPLVREAFRMAQEERPGAVHLELPEDIAKEETNGRVMMVNQARRPAPDGQAVAKATTMIRDAHHPVILIGAGANRKRVSGALKRLVEKTGIPFFNTQLGKGVIDERHPLYLGTAALSENDCLHCAIAESDLIINVGHDVVEKPPFIMRRDGPNVIHINFSSAKVDQIYFPQHEVIGDIANTLEAITVRVMPQAHWDFARVLAKKKIFFEELKRIAESETFPLTPQKIVSVVRKSIPEDGILTLDNGMYKIWFTRNYFAYAANTLLVDNSLATMGAGLPSAIAVKLLHPEKTVVAVVGDGGFMMNAQELETAMRLHLNLTIVVLNDSGYGMIKWKQEAMGFPSFGLDFKNPDFIKFAESFGAHGYRVTKKDEFGPLLSECVNKRGIHVIDVPIDYSGDKKILAACSVCEI